MKNKTEKKYYVVGILWVGPDKTNEEHIDFNRYEITTEPPNIKSSEGFIQIQTFGHLGTNDDIARYAHGQFDSLAEAEHAAIDLLDGEYRRDNYVQDPDVVAVYRPGKYEPMSDEGLGDYIFRAIENEEVYVPKEGPITPEQVAKIVQDLRNLMREDGCDASENRIAAMVAELLNI